MPSKSATTSSAAQDLFSDESLGDDKEDVPQHEPQVQMKEKAEPVKLADAPSSAAPAPAAARKPAEEEEETLKTPVSASSVSPAPASAPASAAAASTASTAPAPSLFSSSSSSSASVTSTPAPSAPTSAPSEKNSSATAAATSTSSTASAPPPAASAGSSSARASRLSSGETSMEIAVSNPERVGEGMSSYVTYTVVAKTSLPSFRQPEVTVKRRYNDFFTLFKHLEAQYPGLIVPPPPPKDALGTGLTKLKGNTDSSFIERRTHGLSRFMQRIASHPVLHGDPMVRNFLESADKMPKVESSVFASVSAKLGSFVETDQWFEEKVRDVDQLESQLKKLHGGVEGLVNRRKELSTATMAAVESLSTLADAEEVDGLKRVVHALSDIEAKVAKLQLQQATADFFDLSEIVSDYLALVGSVRTAFSQRQQAYKAWQTAEMNLVKKKEAEAKAQALGKQDKKEQAAREVLEAESQVQSTKKAYDDITTKLRDELTAFEKTKANEFRDMLIQFVETMMTMEHQILKAWEQFLPDAKGIAL